MPGRVWFCCLFPDLILPIHMSDVISFKSIIYYHYQFLSIDDDLEVYIKY